MLRDLRRADCRQDAQHQILVKSLQVNRRGARVSACQVEGVRLQRVLLSHHQDIADAHRLALHQPLQRHDRPTPPPLFHQGQVGAGLQSGEGEIRRVWMFLCQSRPQALERPPELFRRGVQQGENGGGVRQPEPAAGMRQDCLAPAQRLAKRSGRQQRIERLLGSGANRVPVLTKAIQQSGDYCFQKGRGWPRGEGNVDMLQPGVSVQEWGIFSFSGKLSVSLMDWVTLCIHSNLRSIPLRGILCEIWAAKPPRSSTKSINFSFSVTLWLLLLLPPILVYGKAAPRDPPAGDGWR